MLVLIVLTVRVGTLSKISVPVIHPHDSQKVKGLLKKIAFIVNI
jgi:hypothetical protein